MMKKQRKEGEEEDTQDRISQLPQPLLHHILCYLSQDEAVRTCILSKSWRHLGPTRPKVEFREGWFDKKEEFLSVLDTTLQRYQDQMLSIDFFGLERSEVDSESTPLLEKWVPILMLNMGVKTFNISSSWGTETEPFFDPPAEVFRAQNLHLERCKFSQINVGNAVLFRHLQRLHLKRVYISDEAFGKIMSSRPSIEDLSLQECEGLKTVKVTDKKLKRFVFIDFEVYEEDKGDYDIRIDDVQTIESISIMTAGCPFWFKQHCQNNFMHLKVLYVENMRLSAESFDTFSSHNNFPCLEDLTLDCCYGFEEMKLSSSSIERLSIRDPVKPMTKVTIHAPNILYFHYESYYFLPSSFSFTTASGRHGWKSHLWLGDECIKDSSCFFRLNQVLRALSQSEISLQCSFSRFSDDVTNKGGFIIDRVAVEHLVLKCDSLHRIPRSSVSSFFSLLFRVCRPRNIEPRGVCAIQGEEDKEELAWLLCKFLLPKGKERRRLQRAGLKKVEMESCDKSRDEWLFRLKWREYVGETCAAGTMFGRVLKITHMKHLMIPVAFAEKTGIASRSSIILEYQGKRKQVELHRDGVGKIFIRKQWSDYCKENSFSVGTPLVFEYNEPTLNVVIKNS